MISTYIKLALRSLVNNKVFSFINVFGLSIGLTCCLLICMYIFQEVSYDNYHQHGERLYQLATISINEGEEQRYATTPAPMAPAMQQEYPEVEGYARLIKAFQDDKTLLQVNHPTNGTVNSFYETNGYLADSTFFRLLSYRFIEGDPYSALTRPNSLVVSQEIALKLFGKSPALNKVIHVNSNTNGAYDFTITGVFVPGKMPSHIDARFFMSMHGADVGAWVNQQTGMANNNMFYTYLLLRPGADPKQLEAKFPAFINKYAREDLDAIGRSRNQFLTQIKNIHLHSNAQGNVTAGGNLGYLYILLAIAFVTLLIACVNFMNLATARSSRRAVEIGVRKVLGAEKQSLVNQFLWEAILLSFAAFLISLFFTIALTPLFEVVSGRELVFSSGQYMLLITGFLVITLIAGFIAGVYPAFYLSAFKPVKVLKGKFSNSLAAITFRKGLVVFQFVISVALIVASITISNQMNFLRNKDLGFQKDQQVVVPLRTTNAKNIYASFKNELLNNPAIRSAGASIYYPGITNVTDWVLYKEGSSPGNTKTVFINRVDESFLQTLSIEPVAGRLFSKAFPADSNNRMIINEEAVRSFQFASAEDAIGKNILANFGPEPTAFTVIGVVKNFHFKDLHNNIEAYGFLLNRQPDFNYLIAHANGGDIKSTIDQMEAIWTTLNPQEPFEYSFLDEDFQKNYLAEERLATMIRYFTIIAIFISCLGLFGLTSFSVEQRRKEIGIRKVLGATTAGVIGLLSKDFLKLVVISFVIAFPLAWYFVHSWLQGFAYRAPLSAWMLIAAGGVALLIAFLTISIQSIKVALSNPVKNLRTE